MSWLTVARNEVVDAFKDSGIRAYPYLVPTSKVSPNIMCVFPDNQYVTYGDAAHLATVRLQCLYIHSKADNQVALEGVDTVIETVYGALPAPWTIESVQSAPLDGTELQAATITIQNTMIEIGG